MSCGDSTVVKNHVAGGGSSDGDLSGLMIVVHSKIDMTLRGEVQTEFRIE